MEKCYWIALKNKRARTNCAKYVDLYKSRDLDDHESIKPYEGKECPFCHGIIFTDEHSYDLIDS